MATARQAKRSGLRQNSVDAAQIIRDFVGRKRLNSKLSMQKQRAKTFCLAYCGGKKPCTQWEGLHTCMLSKGHSGRHACGGRDCGLRWKD